MSAEQEEWAKDKVELLSTQQNEQRLRIRVMAVEAELAAKQAILKRKEKLLTSSQLENKLLLGQMKEKVSLLQQQVIEAEEKAKEKAQLTETREAEFKETRKKVKKLTADLIEKRCVPSTIIFLHLLIILFVLPS
jgi:hypothetical protein